MQPYSDSPPPAAPTTEALWRTFKDGVEAFLRRRLPTSADAEDVLQEVFARIHEGRTGLDDAGRVQAWVYGIARRAVADFYRGRYRRVDDASADEAPPLPAEEDAPDVHEEVLSWIRPFVQELPDGYREAVELADVQGLRQQDVADRLGLSLSGAKSRVQRGRVLLGELLQQCCEVEFVDGRAVEYRRREGRCADGCD